MIPHKSHQEREMEPIEIEIWNQKEKERDDAYRERRKERDWEEEPQRPHKQTKTRVSTVEYRIGECNQVLVELWKEYQSSSSQNGEPTPTLQIHIPAKYITSTYRQVRVGQLWGTDVYTDDSDLVAVLMHTGYCRSTSSPPPPALHELCATLRLLPPQEYYSSTLRNNVRSRAWGASSGCSYRVEHCCVLTNDGAKIDLEPYLTYTSHVEPTLAPVVAERTMTTRAATLNALRQQRVVREVSLEFNLCNEPWIKYCLSAVADKGFKKPLYTSARLRKGEVLYLETRSCRYELCFNGEKRVKAAISYETQDSDAKNNNNLHTTIDVFRWSRCKKALPQDLMLQSGIPLPSQYLVVMNENLDWEEIKWSQTGVFVAGKEYTLARVHFMYPAPI